MHIQAAVSRITGHPLSIEALLLDPPRDDEVLVQVVASGVCHTDLGMRDSPSRVPRPIVLGHEGAGVVVQVGKSVKKVVPGDHVVMTFDTCGLCSSCRGGDVAYCANLGKFNFAGSRPDGSTALAAGSTPIHSHFFGQSSFATHSICHERNVVKVPDDVSLDILGPLGCGFQTGAGAVINSLSVSPGSRIAVFGTGAVGLAAIMAARVSGASVIVAIDTQQSRLCLAKELGATHSINASTQNTSDELNSVVPSGLNYVLDTTGNLAVIKQAIAHLTARGVCGLINTAKGADLSANILHLVLGGRSVRGIHQGDSVPDLFIPLLIDLYRQGRFPFDRLLSFYELKDINQAMADMESGRVIKPVIRMPV